MYTRDLPDMYALSPRAYILGKSLMPMLQLLHTVCIFIILRLSTFQKFKALL